MGYTNFYWQVWQFGFYLPDLKLARATLHRDYFQKLVNGDILGVLRSELTSPIKCTKNISASELLTEITKLTKKPTGLDPDHLPPKEYLEKLLWKLDKNHSVFKYIVEEEEELEDKVFINQEYFNIIYYIIIYNIL